MERLVARIDHRDRTNRVKSPWKYRSVLSLFFQDLSDTSVGFMAANNSVALIGIGLLFSRSKYASIVEFARCAVYAIFANANNNLTDTCIYIVHLFSLCSIWIPHYLTK